MIVLFYLIPMVICLLGSIYLKNENWGVFQYLSASLICVTPFVNLFVAVLFLYFVFNK